MRILSVAAVLLVSACCGCPKRTVTAFPHTYGQACAVATRSCPGLPIDPEYP